MSVWSGSRRPRWAYLLLDDQDRELSALDGVTGGSLEVSATTRLGASASLTIDDRGQAIDWMKHRVKVTYDPGIRGVDGWELGVFLFSSPKESHKDDRLTFDVGLLSKMVVPDEDTVERRYSVAAGTNIVTAARNLLASTGETRIAVTESDSVLRAQMVWDAGTSKLSIINDLLEAAGYWALWCDGSGQFRMEPYDPPAEREPSFQFEAGEASIHAPEWSREQDLAAVPNKVIVVAEGADDKPPIVGIATNEDHESPFSYPSRGRWITVSETGVEAATQAIANKIAARRLRDAMSPVARLSVSHAIVPLDPNDVVVFAPSRGKERRATVQRMAYALTFDGQCSAEWREI